MDKEDIGLRALIVKVVDGNTTAFYRAQSTEKLKDYIEMTRKWESKWIPVGFHCSQRGDGRIVRAGAMPSLRLGLNGTGQGFYSVNIGIPERISKR